MTTHTQLKPRVWPRRARRGLANLILTVAVVAIALVVMLGMYDQITTNLRTQTVKTHLATMESELRRAYTSMPQYEANLTPVLWAAMPTNAIQGVGTARRIVTPWGGGIVAGGGNTADDDGTGTASDNRFFISVLGLPEAACESLAQSFLNQSSVLGIDVEGTAATPFTAMNAAAIVAFDTVTEIQAECDGGDDDKIAIVFRG